MNVKILTPFEGLMVKKYKIPADLKKKTTLLKPSFIGKLSILVI